MKHLVLLSLAILGMLPYYSQSQNQIEYRPTEKYRWHALRASKFYERNQFLEAGKSYDSLFDAAKGKGLTNDKYNAACAWALVGDKEKAFYYLYDIALKHKYNNYKHIAEDNDLNILHSDSRWQQLVKKIQSNKEEIEKNYK